MSIKFGLVQISGTTSRTVNMKRTFSDIKKVRAFMKENQDTAKSVKRHWTKDHDQEAKDYWLKENPWFNLTNFEIVEYHLVKKKVHKY